MPPSIVANSSPHRYSQDAAPASLANEAGSAIRPRLCLKSVGLENVPAVSLSLIVSASHLAAGTIRDSNLRPSSYYRGSKPRRQAGQHELVCANGRQRTVDVGPGIARLPSLLGADLGRVEVVWQSLEHAPARVGDGEEALDRSLQ